MEFKHFKQLMQKSFDKMTKEATVLFEISLDKDALWELYLSSFPTGTNEVYRQRREFDCSCCRHFVKSAGNIVVIDNNTVTTIWDFETGDAVFQPVINALSQYVKSRAVSDVYVTKLVSVGTDRNYEKTDEALVEMAGTPINKVIAWDHFFIDFPRRFVNTSATLIGEIRGTYRDTRNVFKRSLDEISIESIETVLELIAQNSLYRGEEWKAVLTQYAKLKKEYDKLRSPAERENFAWEQSVKVGGAMGRIKNHSIGTLLIGISEGEDLEVAVRKYESIVAPANYKRPQAIFTVKMLEDAKKTIEELGYLSSLSRRYSSLDDIRANNILFSNRDSAKRIGGASVFDEMLSSVASSPKKFTKIEEVSVDDFITKVLPTAGALEVWLENKHSSNFVSLISPVDGDAPSMFKWGNAFSWAYSGNITDSDIKERVKSAGGDVQGVLRFSIQWNDGKVHDGNDLDAHCKEPSGNEIYYSSKTNYRTGGKLDVDIIQPHTGVPAVENITWSNPLTMGEGTYKFFVHGYSNRGGRDGFKAEVEFDGQIFSFTYNKEVRQKEDVNVAEVTYYKATGFSIKEMLPSSVSSREVWGLTTNQFIPVSVVMFSPNYWDSQDGIGNRHYFFMMKGCVNPEKPNGFYNEFLKEDLNKHRKVFEALGGKMAVAETDDQLSGLGFSSTMRNELVVKITGQTERIIRVRF